jgi:DNA-binding NarL/FixJ family response regulator
MQRQITCTELILSHPSAERRFQMTAPVQIFIAEQNDVARSVLIDLISSYEDLSVVGASPDGKETLRLCEQLRPHVLLISKRVLTCNGISVAHLLRAKRIPVGIVLLSTGLEEKEEESKARLAGVDVYLFKDESMSKIIDSIRGVYAKWHGSSHPSVASGR